MAQAEVKLFEAESILFPAEQEKENPVQENAEEVVELKRRTLKIDIDKRFARLRKSLRKRSAGIL